MIESVRNRPVRLSSRSTRSNAGSEALCRAHMVSRSVLPASAAAPRYAVFG